MSFLLPGEVQERNARTGFFERSEFDAVLAHLPVDLRPVFEVTYILGWRVKSGEASHRLPP
jgi:hypothetical protein